MTKRKNILQKFQTFLNRQSPGDIKNLHILMAAWRGPDSDNPELKTKYTAKIRATILGEKLMQHICKGVYDGYTKYFMIDRFGGFEVNNKPLTIEDTSQIWKETAGHYAGHTIEAIKLLLKLQE